MYYKRQPKIPAVSSFDDLQGRISEFQLAAKRWVETIQQNPVVKSRLRRFFTARVPEVDKYQKNPNSEFSIIRLFNANHQPNYFLMGPEFQRGGMNRVKFTLPILFLENRLFINMYQVGNLRIGAEASLEAAMGRQREDNSAFGIRRTSSPKSDLYYRIYRVEALYEAIDVHSYFESFTEVQRQDGLYNERVCLIILGLLNEIRILHTAGIVHRDIKWENVLFNPKKYRVYLIDRELCVNVGAHVPVKGSPDYLPNNLKYRHGAEELFKVSFHQDIYALCQTLEGAAKQLYVDGQYFPARIVDRDIVGIIREFTQSYTRETKNYPFTSVTYPDINSIYQYFHKNLFTELYGDTLPKVMDTDYSAQLFTSGQIPEGMTIDLPVPKKCCILL